MWSKLIKILVVLIAVFGIGFVPNANSLQSKIEGRWNVRKAFRNGNETNTLQKAYFEFEKGNKVNFDLTGELQNARYQVNSKLYNKLYGQPTINVSESRMGTNYKVMSVTDTTLNLLGTIQNNDFEFQLYKVN